MTPTTFKRDRPDVAQATHLLSRDEARRIVNIAKLPVLPPPRRRLRRRVLTRR